MTAGMVPKEGAARAPGDAGAAVVREVNLGCGRRRKEGCLNVDRSAEVGPDLLWDLDRFPYPLPDAAFVRATATDVVEHLADIPRFMAEVHRLLEPGGVLEITTPHFSCANSYTDPTHRHHLGYFSFDYFTAGGALDYYAPARFEIVERQIVFHPTRLNRVVAWFARRHPATYERRYAWLFPAWFLVFRLRAVK